MNRRGIRRPFHGSIQAEGIAFHWHLDHPTALFLEHLKENAFDAFEFSLSGSVVARNRAALELIWMDCSSYLSFKDILAARNSRR
jgi:hypothetical protein